MKRPIEVVLTSIGALVVCTIAAYALRPWLIAAVPLAIVSAASIATLRGVGIARAGVALALASAGVLMAIEIYLLNLYMAEAVPDWRPWYPWKRALISIAFFFAAGYLYSSRVNRYFSDLPKQPVPRSTKYWSVTAAIAMLALFTFFYDLYPRLLGWPLTVDRAVDKVVAVLSVEDRAKLAQTSDADLIEYHLGLGMYIRNEFGLWGGNARLLRSACGDASCHPDDASGFIIERVRDRLREKE